MPPTQHDHRIRVCYRDTDQMGMVYYANFFVFMEIGRVELLRAIGNNYRALEESGYLIPVTHASCEYLAPARYDDLIRVRTIVQRATRLRLEFNYELWCDARETFLARGNTQHVFINPQGRPVRAPAHLIAQLQGTAEDEAE